MLQKEFGRLLEAAHKKSGHCRGFSGRVRNRARGGHSGGQGILGRGVEFECGHQTTFKPPSPAHVALIRATVGSLVFSFLSLE